MNDQKTFATTRWATAHPATTRSSRIQVAGESWERSKHWKGFASRARWRRRKRRKRGRLWSWWSKEQRGQLKRLRMSTFRGRARRTSWSIKSIGKIYGRKTRLRMANRLTRKINFIFYLVLSSLPRTRLRRVFKSKRWSCRLGRLIWTIWLSCSTQPRMR